MDRQALMNFRNPRSPQVFRILRTAVWTPVAFRSLMRRLDPADLDAAWTLTFELAAIEQPGAQECAHYLGLWCTQRTLERIWNR